MRLELNCAFDGGNHRTVSRRTVAVEHAQADDVDTLDQAMEMRVEQSGISFDPQIVDVLRWRYRDLEALARTVQASEPLVWSRINVERSAAPDAGLSK